MAEASYTMKRLLKADLKTIFTFKMEENLIQKLNKNPFDTDYNVVEDYQYGGVKVTDNVSYKR